jgi:hypothetical protein
MWGGQGKLSVLKYDQERSALCFILGRKFEYRSFESELA